MLYQWICLFCWHEDFRDRQKRYQRLRVTSCLPDKDFFHQYIGARSAIYLDYMMWSSNVMLGCQPGHLAWRKLSRSFTKWISSDSPKMSGSSRRFSPIYGLSRPWILRRSAADGMRLLAMTNHEQNCHFSTTSSDFTEVGEFAKVDIARADRTGFPEAVFGEGKTAAQIADILLVMHQKLPDKPAIATRVSLDKWQQIEPLLKPCRAEYHSDARVIVINSEKIVQQKYGKVCVVAAGTSDLAVAEEACITLTASGYQPIRVFDVGVAGIHRLFAKLSVIRSADVVIVVAGMDGALSSVVCNICLFLSKLKRNCEPVLVNRWEDS